VCGVRVLCDIESLSIYLAVGAAPQRRRDYLFLSRIRGLAIRGVAETEGRAGSSEAI